MTREEILRKEAGNEFDKTIAEEVMEWTQYQTCWMEKKTNQKGITDDVFTGWLAQEDNANNYDVFRPSTDIAASWEVVKEMSAKNYWCVMEVLSSRCVVMFEEVKTRQKYEAGANTYDLSLAICRAALLAVMEDK